MSNISELHPPQTADLSFLAEAVPADLAACQRYECITLPHAEFDGRAVTYLDIIQEQSAVFLAARWGTERIETVQVNVDGRETGMAAVLLIKNPLFEGGMAIVKWGPLWRRAGAPADLQNLAHVIRAVQQEYVYKRGFHLTIFPPADADFTDQTVALLDQFGFRAGSVLPHPDRYLVNVDQSADDLRASFEQKWRYNLKKSLKHEFAIEQISGEAGQARFMALYEQMISRKKFHETAAVDTLPALIETATKPLNPICFMVQHEGQDTAGAMIDISGDRAVYLYGATDDRALPLKAGYAMQWAIVEYLCAEQQIRWYDLGGTAGDRGLHQFKKGFVGKSGAIVPTPAGYEACDAVSSALFSRGVYYLRALRATIGRAKHKLTSR